MGEDYEEDWLLSIDVVEDAPTREVPKTRASLKKATTCKFVMVGCPFKYLQSQAVKGTRQMQKHVKTNFERHLSLMCKTVKDQDDEIKEHREKIDKQDEIIRQLSQTVREMKQQLDHLKKQRNNDVMVQENLQDDINEVRVNMKKHEMKMAGRVDDLSETVDQFLLVHPITNATENTKDNGRYGEHLWTIHNFSRRLQRIQSGKSEDPIRSEPFYTGLPGYKLCIWVYLNGRGTSLGSAMSVYGRVMIGEFDPILTWPIRPQFTFTLFEQNSITLERKDIVRTRRVHEIKRDTYVKGGIPRPQHEQRSIIVGFDEFVTHEELQLRGFLEDDNVFLKVEAEILD